MGSTRFSSGNSYGQVGHPHLLPLMPSTRPSWFAQYGQLFSGGVQVVRRAT